MFKYNTLIFLHIAIFSIALSDCMHVISEKETKDLIKALVATETGWENEKTTTLEKLANALRIGHSNLTIAASQRVYDKSGKLEKTVRIFCKIPGLKIKNSIDQEKSVTRDDSEKRWKQVLDVVNNLPHLNLQAYAKIIDGDGEVQKGFMSKHFWYDYGEHSKLPKYNFTIVTTKEGMDKISEVFKNAPEPTILKMDVDEKISYEESKLTPINTMVSIGKHSSKIPPTRIIEDAMIAYSKYMLPYPMGPWSKQNKIPFKQIGLDLQSKHSDYGFIVLDLFYSEIKIPCDSFIRLKYGFAHEIKICIYKKDKSVNFVSRIG